MKHWVKLCLVTSFLGVGWTVWVYSQALQNNSSSSTISPPSEEQEQDRGLFACKNCPPLNYMAGQIQAWRDLAGGKLELEFAGLPADHFREYSQLMQKQYGVKVRGVAGCIVEPDIMAHLRGYNDVMEPEIERRFGKGIWSRVNVDAQKLYEHNQHKRRFGKLP
jgi:hypothetical protein